LALTFGRGIEFELGKVGGGIGGTLGGAEITFEGGGEHEGRDEGGEYDVISTDGERARGADEDEGELGDGESSGAGGGGNTK